MEVNNLISSMLQDYSYILKGKVYDSEFQNVVDEIIIKIPMEIQTEFENKYSIDDLLIGHVSVVGIYKGEVEEEFITSNTFTFDLVCEFEVPTELEKNQFLDLLLEKATQRYAKQFEQIVLTEADKRKLYGFDYSKLTALRDIKRVFNDRLMTFFEEKGVEY